MFIDFIKEKVYTDDTKMHTMQYELGILKDKFDRLHDEVILL